MAERVIFDCDNTLGLPRSEIDDGLTLLYLLGRPDIQLLGVTTTFGNGPIDKVQAQTVWLLDSLGLGDLPVERGAGRRGETDTAAARFLAETAAAHPGEVTVLATGPLGNLRAAAERDPRFFSNLKQIACMGGYLEPLRIGWRRVAELNLSADPKGAHAVLNAPCPVVLMNAHICLQAPFTLWDLPRTARWRADLRRAVALWLLAFGFVHCGVGAFYLWDLLPAVYLSHPELFDRRPVRIRSTVEDLETGTLVVADAGEERPVVNMPSRIVDPRRFKAILFSTWDRALGLGEN